MSDFEGSANWPEDFCGKVRLFPLPNLVLFPHVVQPLHIFEPRYCDMLTDALQDDRLLAMALLEKGWEHKYQQRPAVASMVCVGQIISHTPTEDNRHNILLLGMKRARIIEELDAKQPFRTASVEILEDFYPAEESGCRPRLADRLTTLFQYFVPDGLAVQESFHQLFGKQPPLGPLTDTITYALNLPLAIKQQLLAENNVDIRSRILIRCLESQLKKGNGESVNLISSDFPPPFSEN